jgi:prepilin-type N-terminal cleavage/methylation domain-containing protein
MSPGKVQHGFTLVERLVVISLLALLAAALMPIVAPAWEGERPATCLSHLRQVGLAMSLYAEDERRNSGLRVQGSGFRTTLNP